MMTDPIADMLARVKNAGQAGHRRTDMPVANVKVAIARILKENHFIYDYKVLQGPQHKVLRIYMKYYEDRPLIRGIERISRPGRRVYSGVDDLPRVRNGMGIAIVSTSKGVLTNKDAREQHVGGEIMAKVW